MMWHDPRKHDRLHQTVIGGYRVHSAVSFRTSITDGSETIWLLYYYDFEVQKIVWCMTGVHFWGQVVTCSQPRRERKKIEISVVFGKCSQLRCDHYTWPKLFSSGVRVTRDWTLGRNSTVSYVLNTMVFTLWSSPIDAQHIEPRLLP